jgi:hypothetical protein
MAEAKTRPTGASVADFIATVPDEVKRADCQVLVKLMQKATGRKAEMWGDAIVGFGRYEITYANGSKADWPVIGFSPRKNDLTVYLMEGFDQQQALLAKLGKHKTGKVCLYLKRLSDVDMAVLTDLVDHSVQAMAGRRVA